MPLETIFATAVIVSWITVQQWAVWTHWWHMLLVNPLPLVKPPLDFIDLIIICSILN